MAISGTIAIKDNINVKDQHVTCSSNILQGYISPYNATVIDNLEKVGTHLERAQSSYTDSYRQLNKGNDNLVLQATKLKNLGIKNKKELNQSIVNDAEIHKLTE